jgi:hypothetical protein
MAFVAACGGEAAPPEQAVPDLVGATADFAREELEALGLVVELVEVVGASEAPDTVISLTPAPGSSVPAGSLVLVRVAAANTTTTSSSATTTEAIEEVPESAVVYFEDLARGNVAALIRASENSTGLASVYASYLAAYGGDAPADLARENGGVFRKCSTGEDPTLCYVYSNLKYSGDKLVSFDVDGIPLNTVMWNPAHLVDDGVCIWVEEDTCNFEEPGLNDSAYLQPTHAYRTAAGNLAVVIDVISGRRDLDIIWDYENQRLEATAITPGGSVVYPEAWWTYPDVAIDSDLGLRIPAGSRTNLFLSFPGFGGTPGETMVEVNIDWAGSSTIAIDLPNLPSR